MRLLLLFRERWFLERRSVVGTAMMMIGNFVYIYIWNFALFLVVFRF